MLEIELPGVDNVWSEKDQRFLKFAPTKLRLEHSLISVHKWEMKWHKPFLDNRYEKTTEELLDYLSCMSLNGFIDIRELAVMPPEKMKEIVDYIKNSSSAAIFSDKLIGASKSKLEVITSETIYYWMIIYNIPCEFEKWHLESLLSLIKFVSIKSDSKEKKMNMQDSMKYMAAQNAARKAKYHTKG